MGKRYFSVGTESVYGTPVATVQDMDIVSESISPDNQMIDVETAAYREMRVRVPGPFGLGGGVDFVGNPDVVGTLLYYTFCQQADVTSTNDGTVYYHTMSPQQEIDSFTAEIAPAVPKTPGGTDYKLRRAEGGFITSLSLEATARELVTGSADMTFQTESIQTDDQLPTFSTLNPLVYHQGTVEIEDSTLSNVEAFSVTFENDIDTDAFTLGSRFLPSMQIQGFGISGELDLQFNDWTSYQKVYDGVGTASEPVTLVGTDTYSSQKLELNLVGEASDAGVGNYANYQVKLEFPNVYFDTAEASFDRRDRIVNNLGWTALYDAGAGYSCIARVTNLTDISAL